MILLSFYDELLLSNNNNNNNKCDVLSAKSGKNDTKTQKGRQMRENFSFASPRNITRKTASEKRNTK